MNKLTKIAANFSTTVLNNMSVGSSSGVLSSVTDKDGQALAAGKYCMIFNAGEATEEHLLFDLSGANMTNIQSVSRQGVLTANTQKLHNAGSSVKLTDFANIHFLSKLLTGAEDLDGSVPLKYDATPTLSDAKHIATKGYVDTNAVLTSGAQSIAGVKTFSSAPKIPDATASDEAFTKGQFDSSAVTLAGNQTISGIKTFNSSPVVPDAVNANQPATFGQLQATAIAGGVDASTTAKGISKLSVAPVSSTNPIAVGDNDTRIPTQSEKNAMTASTSPSSSNPFLTAAQFKTYLAKLTSTINLESASVDFPLTLDTEGVSSDAFTLTPNRVTPFNPTGGSYLNIANTTANWSAQSFTVPANLKNPKIVNIQWKTGDTTGTTNSTNAGRFLLRTSLTAGTFFTSTIFGTYGAPGRRGVSLFQSVTAGVQYFLIFEPTTVSAPYPTTPFYGGDQVAGETAYTSTNSGTSWSTAAGDADYSITFVGDQIVANKTVKVMVTVEVKTGNTSATKTFKVLKNGVAVETFTPANADITPSFTSIVSLVPTDILSVTANYSAVGSSDTISGTKISIIGA